MKYLEYCDSTDNWESTEELLIEIELFYLEDDLFEIHDIANNISNFVFKLYSDKIQRMLRCKGLSCYNEYLRSVFEGGIDRIGKPWLSYVAKVSKMNKIKHSNFSH